jgi:hypothetical protein
VIDQSQEPLAHDAVVGINADGVGTDGQGHIHNASNITVA